MKKAIDFRIRLGVREALKARVPEPITQFKRYVELYKVQPRLTY